MVIDEEGKRQSFQRTGVLVRSLILSHRINLVVLGVQYYTASRDIKAMIYNKMFLMKQSPFFHGFTV